MQFDPISRGTRFFGAASFLFGSSESEQVLDALPARAALVDAAGRLGVVNAAWRSVATGSDFFPQGVRRGLSYLDLCDATTGVNAGTAWTIANGLRSVLGGAVPSFELQYSWHFANVRRDFKCLISSLSQEGVAAPRGAVILHVELAVPADEAMGEPHGASGGSGASDGMRDIGMVADRVPALVFYVDADLTFRAANRQMEKWFGVASADIVGMGMVEVTGPVLFRRIQSHVYTALSGRRVGFEDMFEEPPGTRRWFQATFIPDTTPEGRVRGFSALAYDITRYKALEHDLDEAKVASERCTRLQSDLLGHVAVEMKSPLTSILGFSETLANALFGPLADPYQEYAKDIRDTASSLVEMAGDLVDLAKIQSGQLQLDEERIDLKALLTTSTGRAQQMAKGAGVRLVVKVGRSVPGLFADERMLRQVILNLVAAVVRLSPDGATITLTTRNEEDGGLGILVTNPEAAVAQKDLDHLLKPFARLEVPRASAAVMGGLTLPLTSHFMQLHGGSLELRSGPKSGVTVAAVFPRPRLVS
ncbi:MAG: PAS domain-containing protein [Alphaproteobacteria bacterium]